MRYLCTQYQLMQENDVLFALIFYNHISFITGYDAVCTKYQLMQDYAKNNGLKIEDLKIWQVDSTVAVTCFAEVSIPTPPPFL